MQAERWKKVEELFEAAQTQPSDQRAEFLREACVGDPEMRAEVESLLTAAKSCDPLLDGSPLSSIAERPPALRAGDKLGNFQIVELIGRGGMGEVYRARDLRLKRDVAIKTLPPGFAGDRDRIARFEREARSASALNHPNIVSVYEFGDYAGVSFIVSELVEGETLARVIQRGPIPIRKLIEVSAQICDGLAAAHAAGVVHRDLKPGNIMLTRDGRVKILDFGLARQMPVHGLDSTTMDFSHPGVIMGTPGYMSPEQVRGEAADARSDLFSVGVVLYEMASGKPAFGGTSSVEMMNSILKDEPSELPPTSPPDLGRIVSRCMEKEPPRRFQSAADLCFALKSIPTLHAPTVPKRGPLVWPKRVAIVAICLAVAGVAYWMGQSSRPAGVIGGTTMRRLTGDGGLTTDGAISTDGKFVAYASDRADLGNLDIWIQQVDGNGTVRLTDDPADDHDPSFSPDGSQIAFRSERDGGGIYVVPSLGGESHLLIPEGKRPRFSPDGQMLLYESGFVPGVYNSVNLFIRRISGGAPKHLGDGCGVQSNSAVWSLDGRHILFDGGCTGHHGLWVSTLEGQLKSVPDLAISEIDQWIGDPSRLLVPVQRSQYYFGSEGETSFSALPISADGMKATGSPRRLTFGTGNETRASAAATGRIALSAVSSQRHVWGLAIDNDGRATAPPTQLTSGSVSEVMGSLSRDGSNLVFTSPRADRPTMYWKNLATGKQREVPWEGFTLLTPILSFDSTRIGFSNYATRPDHWDSFLYEVPVQGGLPRKLWGEPDMGYVIWDWSPDGSTFLLEPSRNGTSVQALDLKSLSKSALLDDPETASFQTHFSGDGRWVTFNGITHGRSRIYVAPFRKAVIPKSEWIPITEGISDDKPHFSHDDKLIFFTSHRDGFRCIWAQRLGPAMIPSGEAFAVYHFHQHRSSISLGVSGTDIAVSANLIVFSRLELTGNIWLLEPAKAGVK